MASKHQVDEDVVREILSGARDLIERFGWKASAYSLHGAAPRCIRKAVFDAAVNVVDTKRPEIAVALQRISEAIHKRRNVVGGINDWEYRKSTDKEAVVAMLGKAIELGPVDPMPMPEGVL